MKTFLCLFFTLWTIQEGISQEVMLSAAPQTSDIQAFMLSDFNFTGQGTTGIELFQVTLANVSTRDLDLKLTLHIQAEIYGVMAEGQTDNFSLNAGETLQLTNKELFSWGNTYTLRDYHISDIGDDLYKQLLSSGRLPADMYYFIFELYESATLNSLGQTVVRFNLTNPQNLDLISPGTVATSDTPILLHNPYPLFRWESDLYVFQLKIAEKLPDMEDELSPEEVIQQRVIFDKTFQINQSTAYSEINIDEQLPSTLYPYPAIGAPVLRDGYTYYWQVTGFVKTSGGIEQVPSEIWRFQMALGASSALTPLQQQILYLVRELNPELFTTEGSLFQFTPTEQVIGNGVPLEEQEILDILTELVDGEHDILEIVVE